MDIRCVWEHNGEDTLLWAVDYPGAFTRGASLREAMEKMPQEIAAYSRWAGTSCPDGEVTVVQDAACYLAIADADSDVLFQAEREPLTAMEYEVLRNLALASAEDLLAMYRSFSDPDATADPPRETFYGDVPRSARAMYEHTKNVNAYYFGELGVEADNEGDILLCRERGFAALEEDADVLDAAPHEGSFGEWWSPRKVLRRFLWHDRIHARAMWKLAGKLGDTNVQNTFCF